MNNLLSDKFSSHIEAYNVYSTNPCIVDSKIYDHKNQDYALYCFNDDSRYIKFRDSEKNTYYQCRKGEWTLNHQKGITTSLVQQPKGYYCEKCLDVQDRQDYPIQHDDGDVVKFWSQCKECKLASSRGYAAKKWTEVLKEASHDLKDIRFATFTMKNPSYNLKDVFPYSLNWFDSTAFNQWFYENTRTFSTKDGTIRHKYISQYIPEKIMKLIGSFRKKLILRFKNIRNKNKNFIAKVKGGLFCFECTINIDPINMKLELNPHIHAILHGSFYSQGELQDDWKLGIVDIRGITDTWKVQLEVAKYVGKDGSRRTSFGSLRSIRKELLSQNKKLPEE